ncbi:MAG: ATP-binding cassette domain-containing protein [Proteobacteria bacterium]|nr:ATP-binding cassette domain-containing protein [Pseudomonadota bacterium]
MQTDPQKYVVEAEHFAVGYGERTILHDISVKIRRGSVTCICGGSGCGKSTFLRATLGLVPHKGGEARVLGENINQLEGDKRSQFLSRVGFMYQNGGLINSLTILENLKIPLKAHTNLNEKVIEELVYHKLAQVQLTHAVNLLPGELSGGMLKRAGFARAIILEPELVLSDEPSAGLDPVTAADLDDLMIRLKNELGISLIVVTHDLDSIKRIADRIVMLEKGYVKFDGPLKDALKSKEPLVKNFFARAPSEGHAGISSLWNLLKG